MALYCLTQDGAILDGPRELPDSWQNVSNLAAFDDGTLASLGWVRYVADTAPIIHPTRERVVGTRQLLDGVVRELWTVQPLQGDELTAAIAKAVAALRADRDQRLRDSDWMVLPDAPLSPAVKLAALAYRQALRDLPASAAADPALATWPTPPIAART